MARLFSGTDQGNMTMPPSFIGYANTNPITMSMWALLTNVVTTFRPSLGFTDNAGTARGFSMILTGLSNTSGWGGLFCGVNYLPTFSSENLSVNTWHHLGLRYDGANNWNLWRDNAQRFSGTASFIALQAGDANVWVTINNSATGSSSFADIVFWKTYLTDAEMSALSGGARPQTIRQTFIDLPFDGLQSPEPDFSGNKNNVTLTGSTVTPGPPVDLFTPRWPQQGWTPMLPAAGLSWIINRRNKLMVPKRKILKG